MRRPEVQPSQRQFVSNLIDGIVEHVSSSIRSASPVKLRVLVGLSALLLMLVSFRSALAETTAPAVDSPIMIQVALTNPAEQLELKSAARAELMGAVTEKMAQTAAAHPDSVLVLRVRPGALRFNRLSQEMQEQLIKTHGSDAAQWYEQSLATLLHAMLQNAHGQHSESSFSVYGLPIEGRPAGVAATNARYAAIVQQIDVLVAGWKPIVSHADAGTASAVEQRLPAAMLSRSGRLLYYRMNSQWRVYGGNAPTSQRTGHTAQDAVTARAMDMLARNPDLVSILKQHGIDPAQLASTLDEYDQLDLLALLADWGVANSQWDLNGDGTVNIFDLLELLASWNEPDAPDSGIARFAAMDSEYVIGSGVLISVELLADAPSGADVVFQTWSDVSSSIESAYHDTSAPFEYPTGALDHVTPGPAEIQALVRDAQDQVVLRLTARIEFVLDPGGDDDPDDNGEDDPPVDDPLPAPDDGDDAGDDWSGLFVDLDESLVAHLQPIDLPTQPQLDNPRQFDIHSPGDIPNPIPSNSVLTVHRDIELPDANAGFVFNQGASDVLVQFAQGAQIQYTGGFSDRAVFQFRSSAARIRIENAVITGPTGTRNTCHGFATMLGSGTCSDITIVGGEVSGVRYTFQGEGGCERLLITGVRAHSNWEYFVWGSNTMNNVTICHNTVDGVEVQHGIRLAPGVVGVNIVSNDIRVGQQGLIKRSIWIAGAYNVTIVDNHTRDGRITIGPNPAFNEPGPRAVVLAGNTIDHDRNNLAIELFSGTRSVLVSGNTVTTPHSNWMQVGVTDQFNRPFEDIHWTQDNIANDIERHGFDGIRVSAAYVGQSDIGPVD